jgi:ubiquinone/menaquinone biosynthesis C-methylase UbiE
MEKVHADIIMRGLRSIDGLESIKVLDIGIGYSILAIDKMIHKSEIVGIDISETALSEAEHRIESQAKNNNGIVIEYGNVSKLQYEPNEFDVITSFQSHYFWPDFDANIRNVSDLLKENGIFILTGDEYKMKYHNMKYLNEEDYCRLFDDISLNVIDCCQLKGFLIIAGRKRRLTRL